MNLRHLSLKTSFCLTLFYFLLFLVIQPKTIPTLQYFTPFLICAIYRTSKNHSLWLALGAGLIMDLYASSTHFGFYAVSNTIALWMSYGLKRHFFADHLSTLPILSGVLSGLLSLIQLALLFLFDQGFAITGKWILTDLITLSALDALYALLAFTLPITWMAKTLKWAQVRRHLHTIDETD